MYSCRCGGTGCIFGICMATLGRGPPPPFSPLDLFCYPAFSESLLSCYHAHLLLRSLLLDGTFYVALHPLVLYSWESKSICLFRERFAFSRAHTLLFLLLRLLLFSSRLPRRIRLTAVQINMRRNVHHPNVRTSLVDSPVHVLPTE